MVTKEGGHYVKANNNDSKMEHGVHNGGDSDDSKDSDTLQLFELPKRKLVRPISSSLRRKVSELFKFLICSGLHLNESESVGLYLRILFLIVVILVNYRTW